MEAEGGGRFRTGGGGECREQGDAKDRGKPPTWAKEDEDLKPRSSKRHLQTRPGLHAAQAHSGSETESEHFAV